MRLSNRLLNENSAIVTVEFMRLYYNDILKLEKALDIIANDCDSVDCYHNYLYEACDCAKDVATEALNE